MGAEAVLACIDHHRGEDREMLALSDSSSRRMPVNTPPYFASPMWHWVPWIQHLPSLLTCPHEDMSSRCRASKPPKIEVLVPLTIRWRVHTACG